MSQKAPDLQADSHQLFTPAVKELRRFYKENHVWTYVKDAMIAEGKIAAQEDTAKEVED